MQMRQDGRGWYLRHWVPGLVLLGESHKASPPTKSPSHKWGPGRGCSEGDPHVERLR